MIFSTWLGTPHEFGETLVTVGCGADRLIASNETSRLRSKSNNFYLCSLILQIQRASQSTQQHDIHHPYTLDVTEEQLARKTL